MNGINVLYFCVHFVCRTKNIVFKKLDYKVLFCCGPVHLRAVVTRLVQAGKLERGLYGVLLHHPIKQALNLVYRPPRGQSFPFPLLPLVFYIDKRHISINYSYNNSLSHTLLHFLTNT